MKSTQYRAPLFALTFAGLVAAAHADPLATWTFENGTGTGIVHSDADSTAAYVTGSFVQTTGSGTIENLNGDNATNPYTSVLPGLSVVTRNFGTDFVYATFTTLVPITLTEIDFGAQHNHNFPSTANGYSIQLGLASGAYSGASTFTDFGSSVFLSPTINNKYHMLSVASSAALGPGTYTLRWAPLGLGSGATNTGSDYFALGQMQIEGAPTVPGPAAFASFALSAVAMRRRQKAKGRLLT